MICNRLLAAALAAFCCPLWAQQGLQHLVEVPRVGVSDSFYESYGVGWNYNRMRPDGSGFFFNFNNGGAGVAPPFGGFDPGSAATFGVGFPGGGINFSAAQGSSRLIVADSASVMVPNGGGGAIFSGSQRPFVTGIIPVVGAGGCPGCGMAPRLVSPLALKLQQLQQQAASGMSQAPAERAAANRAQADDAPLRLSRGPAPAAETSAAAAPTGSLSELKRRRAAAVAEQREEARRHIVTARKAESDGRRALARSEYLVAIDLVAADDPWRAKILDRLRAIAENE